MSLTTEQLQFYNDLINNEYNKIYQLKHKIIEIETNIINIKKHLLDNCNHERVIDRSSINEHTEYICKKCNSSL